MSRKSFQRYNAWPGAAIGIFPVLAPLWSVSSIGLTSTYHVPPIGAGKDRVLIDSHDDQITIAAVLPGPERFIWKEGLEWMAELSVAWNPWQSATNGFMGGLTLWTKMTLRTDVYIKSLSFTANAQKRDALDVSMSLVHLPRPGLFSELLDLGNVAASVTHDVLT